MSWKLLEIRIGRILKVKNFVILLFKNLNIFKNRDFANSAVGVLDLSFSQSDSRAYDVLNRKDPDLNNLTAIELAYNSDNKVN